MSAARSRMMMAFTLAFTFLALVFPACLCAGDAGDAGDAGGAGGSPEIKNATAFVGMSARIEQIVLPGPELKTRPLADRERPIVLRIEQTYPHGSDFRYDMIYYGLEPGEYDLRDYLTRVDGSPANDLPPLMVKIESSLPAGQIEPHALEPGTVPRLGGYRGRLFIAGAFWFLGLAAITLVGRRRKTVATQIVQEELSLDERLRNVAELVVSGRFGESDKSQLERLLLAYWRRRLGLEDAKPAEAMAAMRSHYQAAHLLDQLERWLHRPAGIERVDVVELLRPYLGIEDRGQRTEGSRQRTGGRNR